MSQKKHKKRKPQPQKAAQNPMELQQTEKTKRMKPAARNLLWIDMIFLAVCQIMVSKEAISSEASGIATLVGLTLLVAALAIQFGPKDKKPRGPRL